MATVLAIAKTLQQAMTMAITINMDTIAETTMETALVSQQVFLDKFSDGDARKNHKRPQKGSEIQYYLNNKI